MSDFLTCKGCGTCYNCEIARLKAERDRLREYVKSSADNGCATAKALLDVNLCSQSEPKLDPNNPDHQAAMEAEEDSWNG